MIFPIRAYGDPVLRKKCEVVQPEHPDLADFIANMYETMDSSNGVGLAAPQIGRKLRLFVIDSTHMYKDKSNGLRTVFINPEILEEEGEDWPFEEGCLSIPHIREDVLRKPNIKVKYFDGDFKEHEQEFDGMTARVIQHEYDHIEGILFLDHISSFKRQLLKGKLKAISKGLIDINYRMKFPERKR